MRTKLNDATVNDPSRDNSLDDVTIIRDPQLAKLLGVSLCTLWRMGKRGELPPKIQISRGANGKGANGRRLSDIRAMLIAKAGR